MIGIDIIDLTDPLLKERTERSLNLIQHEDDQTVDHPNLFWLLWSAKEAVFKCRREPLNFAPKTIPIQLSQVGGTISFKSGMLMGRIIQEEQYILAICSDQLDDVNFEVFEEKNDNWNDRIRELIIKFFSDKGLEYTIGSDELNLPTLLPSNQPISVSHHGKMGAFIYSRMKKAK